jgi:hypothetical protein
MVAIAGGEFHSLALTSDGVVRAWGAGTNNTGGSPELGQSMVPVDLSNVVAIACGDLDSLALKSDGTVVSWGADWNGRTNVPPGLSNVVAIAAGGGHSLALSANGTVVAWGFNKQGPTNVPPDLSNVVAIAAGLYSSFALGGDRRLTGWGGYWYDIDIYVAVTVPAGLGLSNVVGLAAGPAHSLALKSDGTVVTWGPADSLVQAAFPSGLSNVVSIAATWEGDLALMREAPIPSQASLTNPRWDDKGFAISLPTQRGRVYGLEYTDSLPEGNWMRLPLAAGNGGLLTLRDRTSPAPRRFYRVRRW